MAAIRIVGENCIGCKKCVEACPFGAIRVENKKAVISEACTLCGSCVESCRFGAIELTQAQGESQDISHYSGIWVFCQQFRNQLNPVALELLGQARQIGDALQQKVSAVLFGADIGRQAEILIAAGADQVILAEESWLGSLDDLTYTSVMTALVRKYQPSILLLGATAFGRSFAPRLAARLRTGLTADCTVLAADTEKGLLLQTRPAFGGNIMATIVCPDHRPQMATVRPKVFKPLAPDYSRRGDIIRESLPQPKASGMQLKELLQAEGENINIASQDIIVAAGRGVSAKDMPLVEELARLLGGAVAVSRPMVDAGIKSYSHQVGQTGKTVAPKLYVACGISGAIQHVAGIAAETVVAVNKDPDAPIFQYAHYGIVGDCVEFLESAIKEVKAWQEVG